MMPTVILRDLLIWNRQTPSLAPHPGGSAASAAVQHATTNDDWHHLLRWRFSHAPLQCIKLRLIDALELKV